MKKIITTALALSSVMGFAQDYNGKVGINTDQPKATLDLSVNTENAQDGKTTNEGLLVPRLKKSRVGTMANPESSTLVYVDTIDTSSDPRVENIKEVGFYFFDKPNNTWKTLGSGGESLNQSQMLSATYVGASGSWMQNISANGNTITFKVTNTSSYTFAGLNFNQALILNNASQGLTYTPAEDYSSVSFTANQTKTFVYNISGTPVSYGTLTANFNTAGVSAFGNIPVQEASQTKSIEISFAGTYQAQKPLTNANTITLKVHNFTTQAVNGVDMSQAIELSGIDGVSVVANQNTNVDFPAGQTVSLTYTLSGTPATSGILLARNNATLQVAGNVSGSQAVDEMTGVSASGIAISFDGDYFVGQKMEDTNVVKITLSNANNYTVSNLNLSQALSLSGVGAEGVSVVANQNTAVSIPANSTQVIIYTLTGTPTQPGTITANWADSRITGTQTADRQVDQWEISPETIVVSNYTQNNYDFTITVKSTEPWEAELVNTSSNQWIKNIRKNNTSGNGTVQFDTEPRGTDTPSGYRFRLYKTSEPNNGKNVYVFQDTDQVITLPTIETKYFDIAGDTQYIETNYAGEIKVLEKPDWVTSITQEGTKLKVVSAPRTDVGGRKYDSLYLEFEYGRRQKYGAVVQKQKAGVCPETKPSWVPNQAQYYKMTYGASIPENTISWIEYMGDFDTVNTSYSSGFATKTIGYIEGKYAAVYTRKSVIDNKSDINAEPKFVSVIYPDRNFYGPMLYMGNSDPEKGQEDKTIDVLWGQHISADYIKSHDEDEYAEYNEFVSNLNKQIRVVICSEGPDNY